MSDIHTFKLSPKFIETVLANNFSIPNTNYTNTTIYVGLGIEFNEDTFTFTKEPVSKWYTINQKPCIFSEPVNGIIRNASAIEWEKAKVNWTTGSDKINYIGLYYRKETNNLVNTTTYDYELIAVLPLVPAETVLVGEKMVLNPNSIQLKLSNR